MLRGRGPLWLGLLLAVATLETAGQKDVPAPKMSKLMGPSITFLYCYS